MEPGRKSREDLMEVWVNKSGFKGAVFAKCIECIYDERSPGTWRQQVEECTGRECPLFNRRPKTV